MPEEFLTDQTSWPAARSLDMKAIRSYLTGKAGVVSANVAYFINETEEFVNKSLVTPTATPEVYPAPTPPGLESVFAIGGLLAVAYLVKRRRK